jgi:hypothetical protein
MMAGTSEGKLVQRAKRCGKEGKRHGNDSETEEEGEEELGVTAAAGDADAAGASSIRMG